MRSGLSALCGVALLTSVAASQSPVLVDATVPAPPVPVTAMGKTRLVYELHVTNRGARPLPVIAVTALRGDSTGIPTLSELRGDLLNRSLVVLGPVGGPGAAIPPNGRAIVFFFITVEIGGTPTRIRHALTFAPDSAGGKPRRVEFPAISLPAQVSTTIAPPLHGRWIAANGPANETGHRRSMMAFANRTPIAQRFAIDWIGLGPDGKLTRDGDMSRNASYYGYGADVLSVAEGVVEDVHDGIPENVAQTPTRAVPITLETIGGNYVLVDIGGGRHAFYAHLQPGRLRVKKGDRVKTGQVLGAVGNSGNSDLPHLHFHITNGPSGLDAEGIPYLLDTFATEGTVILDETFVKEGFHPPGGSRAERRMEIPLLNTVVIFR